MNNMIEKLSVQLQDRLQQLNITSLSSIQAQCIPHALNHEDILAQAPTGSGKTYAYLLPILDGLTLQGKGKHFPQAMILAPTRELSLQIAQVIRELLMYTEGIRTTVLTGGIDIKVQIRSFSKGADIVVGTPSRICDHLRRHTLKTKKCTTIVIDEADEMLKMGFFEDVNTIIASLPQHQTMMFSATYSSELKALAESLLSHPFECIVEQEVLLKQDTKYLSYEVYEDQKIDLLKKLLKQNRCQTILFCNTKKTCDFVCQILKKNHYACNYIHSDMDPKTRKAIMQEFKNGKLNLLIATDVASRGVDIPSVGLVISYDVADTMDAMIHRFGRTARAKTSGSAIVFVTPLQKKEMSNLSKTFPSITSSKFHLKQAGK